MVTAGGGGGQGGGAFLEWSGAEWSRAERCSAAGHRSCRKILEGGGEGGLKGWSGAGLMQGHLGSTPRVSPGPQSLCLPHAAAGDSPLPGRLPGYPTGLSTPHTHTCTHMYAYRCLLLHTGTLIPTHIHAYTCSYTQTCTQIFSHILIMARHQRGVGQLRCLVGSDMA